MVRTHRYAINATLLLALLPVLALANVAELPRTQDDINIDGLLDDLAWRDAAQIKIDKETRPGENIAAKVETVAYLIEDGEHLYIAFDAKDPNPAAIRAYLRDSFLLDPDEPLADDTSLLRGGIVDSTGVLEMVAYLEDTYEIEFQAHEISEDHLDSIERVTRLVLQKLGG